MTHRGIGLADPRFPWNALRSSSWLRDASARGCDDPDGVVPLCWMRYRGRLELLPHLEPGWRAEFAHAVLHLGLIGAYYRLGRRRA